MRNKIGNFLMVLGTALVLGALSLFLFNQHEAWQAGQASQELLEKVIEEIPDETTAEDFILPGTPLELIDPRNLEMKEVIIDGYAYIGYLSIPDLGLDLPILSGWDKKQLSIAPCRYSGTLLGEDLVIMAHNYIQHFGTLHKVPIGGHIYFTDMNGVTTEYEVIAIEVLAATAVDQVTSGEYDLTLFTCTFNGRRRTTVYCDAVKE